MFEQAPSRALSDTGDFEEFRRAVAHLAPLAMEGYSEAVGLVANELDQVQDRRMMIERDRIFLLSVNVENLFAFGDGGQGLVDDLELFQRFGGGVELAQTSVDQD